MPEPPKRTYGKRNIDMVLLQAALKKAVEDNEDKNREIKRLCTALAQTTHVLADVKNERDVCRQVLTKWIAMDQMECVPRGDGDQMSVNFITQPDNVQNKWVFVSSFHNKHKWAARAFNDTLLEASQKEFKKFSDRKVGEMKRKRLSDWCAEGV